MIDFQVANPVLLRLLPADVNLDVDVFVLQIDERLDFDKVDATVATNSSGTKPTIQELVTKDGRLAGFAVNQQVVERLEDKLKGFYGQELSCKIS